MTSTEHGTIDVSHDEAGNRFVMRAGEESVGLIEYRREGDVFDLHHTEILPEGQGQGLGTVLVRDVLDDLRSQGQQIRATCPFVARFIDEHQDYADLVAAES